MFICIRKKGIISEGGEVLALLLEGSLMKMSCNNRLHSNFMKVNLKYNFVTGCVDDESHSSADSEFVEATQQNFDSESSVGSSTKDTEEVVQQNMEFLKASWGCPILFPNVEPNDIHVEHTSNPHLDTYGFQQVISNNSKKLKNTTVVQKASVIKSNCPIRSRVGTSKSLK